TAIPVTASVEVPKNTGVSIVPNSFNVAPAQIISGTDFDTLVWNTAMTALTPNPAFTWQTTVSSLQPGEARAVDLGGTVDLVSQGTAGELTLASQFVTGQQIIGINPPIQSAVPGASAAYTITLKNPTTTAQTYQLAVPGMPASWVNVPFQVNVPA